MNPTNKKNLSPPYEGSPASIKAEKKNLHPG